MAGNLTLNQIYGIPDGVDPTEWYRSQYSDQTGMQTAIPGGMDPSNRSMLAQLLNGTLTGDFTSLGGFGAPGGSINDAALNEALQKRYGTTNVLSRYSDDTPGWVTGRGTMTRELYAANPDGTYRPTGDKLATENDATSDLITSISMIAPFVGGQIASAYGAAGTGASAAEISAAEALASGGGTIGEYGQFLAGLTPEEMALVSGASASAGSAAPAALNAAADTQAAGTLSEADIASLHAASGGGSTGGGFFKSLGSALGGTGTWGNVASAAGSALGNMSLGDWAKLATVAAGAAGGAQGSGGDTTTQTRQMDPRLATLFYGLGPTDTNSITGAAFNNWQQNKSGMNDTIRAGNEAQRAIYTNPNTVNQINGIAQGLLSQPVAGNPFTQGLLSQPVQQQPRSLLTAPSTRRRYA